jgi:hypothetical protein
MPGVSLSERDLSHLWEGQRFPAAALRTRSGEQLRVVYRGRANAGAGPDFRDAIIAAPDGLLQGDVELHVRSSDFRRHGHHLDSAYDGLALHVAFWHDEQGDTQLAGGRRVPVASLAEWVQERTQEIEGWLARPAQWQEPCRTAVPRLGASEVAGTLDRLGTMRFRQLTAVCAGRLQREEAAELLWQGLLEALGYGGQRPAFRRLAQDRPWRLVQEAIAPLPAKGRAAAAERMLLPAAQENGLLEAGHGRPGNRPGARLRGAAQLAARCAVPGLLETLLAPLEEPGGGAAGRMLCSLTVTGAIGRARAVEMLTNAVLPLAAALDGGRLTNAAEAAYSSLALPARYGSVRHLHSAVGADCAVDARRQQGMLYLLKVYCARGGCGRCPLS